jgi:acylphosphatase
MRPVLLALSIAAVVAGPCLADDKPAPKKKEDYKGKPAARMVHYTGDVQGVGFRDTAVRISRDYPVTGWVKNLSDGRVQLLAEGPADAIDDFLKAIRDKWKDNIKDAKVEEQKVSGKYQKFTVER